jgi:hypothetical protein
MYELPVFESGYTSIPTFWIEELMPYAAGIPASFWKYMIVLWRELFGVNCETKGYRAAFTMSQFHMTKETAMQWTAAVAMSGLFEIEYGFRYKPNQPGVPTTFKYREESTVEEWMCFIVALRDTILEQKSKNFQIARRGIENFRYALSFKVDRERERRGYSLVWKSWQEEEVKSGRIERLPDGGLQWGAYRTSRSRLSGKEDLEYIKSLEKSLGVYPGDD